MTTSTQRDSSSPRRPGGGNWRGETGGVQAEMGLGWGDGGGDGPGVGRLGWDPGAWAAGTGVGRGQGVPLEATFFVMCL